MTLLRSRSPDGFAGALVSIAAVKTFALQNLVRNRARTLLALLGLAASTAGVVLLVSISFGARRMVGDAMTMAKGIIILQRHAPDPTESRIPASLEPAILAVPGVSAVTPELWTLAFSIEGRASLTRGVTNMTTLLGVDPMKRASLRGGGMFARALVEGRPFTSAETDGVLISTHVAKDFKKRLGSKIEVMEHDFTITGIFDTGTWIFDNVVVVQEDPVRSIAGIDSSSVSSFYAEVKPGEDVDAVARAIARALPRNVEVKSTLAWGHEVSKLVSTLDPYLAAISFVAGTIGALGVVNTMLMSVRERVRELGVLRATGWTRGDVFRLVLLEASLLGALGGASGALLGAGVATVAAHVLPIKPDAPLELVLASIVVAVVLGAAGGLYPAIYAARLDPIGAIRGGA
jgi:putative ABC transport system permease protein